MSDSTGTPENTPVAQAIASTRAAFESALLAFIQKRAVESRKWPADGPPILRTTPLFEDRIIDSLAIIDLIAFVERATGQQIPTKQIVMKYFRTVEAIADTFWQTVPENSAGEPNE